MSMVKRWLEDLSVEMGLDGEITEEVMVPECLRGAKVHFARFGFVRVPTWDWLYAVTHRALLAADVTDVWIAKDK